MESKEAPISKQESDKGLSKQKSLSSVNKIIIAIVATVILATLLIVGGNIYTQNNYINWKKEEDKKALEQEQAKELLRTYNLQKCESNEYEVYLEMSARNCTSQLIAWGITKVTYSKEDMRQLFNEKKGTPCLLDVEYQDLQKNIGKEYKASLDNCLRKYPPK